MTENAKGLNKTRIIGLIVAVIAFIIPFVVQFDGLSVAGHRVLSIFLMAIALWISEAIPLHATAALIIILEILFISDKAMLPLPAGFDAPSYKGFYGALASPVLMLFLGGFFLADGAAKFNLDTNLVRVLIKPFGTMPSRVILGLMLITAIFSMFMSNTATTATMIAVVLPLIAKLPEGDRTKIGLVLAIPVAANIGGMGTPVGTPPNAIALGALAKEGVNISFVNWMIMVIPFMLIVLFFAWFVLAKFYSQNDSKIEIDIDSKFETTPKAILFYIVAAATILLWFTEKLHGIPSTIVGFMPVVVLLATGVINQKEFHSMQWSVLWLVAGGIAMGSGVGKSGLDQWLIGLINWAEMSPAFIAGGMFIAALLMGSVISHSATANLLVPIGMSLATAPGVAISPVASAVFIAIGSSLAMALPISTPPNAIAYSTGAIKTKDMAITGIMFGILGTILYAGFASKLWNLLGIMPE
ncbi:SLC13 family permease [Pontiella agarivorans]|uniref:DASS family sodium-coupled anion symporter n=1 Tax=Pontiella agarivorans TaxID=3038953 RepID=A0ABU5N0U8_9BACT|nr:DASS family sodium-coupled anion symporter [Pontiella agarivorans]MDZ8120067.1 DASS family sodium-coupled anion symporter [Pontiella agarivorans]